jgi:Family of unknown function (DUF6069)
MQNTKPAGSEIIAWTPLPWVALLAAFATAVANALVYFAASGLGYISHSVLISSPTGEKPLSVEPVVISSVAGAIGAAIFFALVSLFARRPVRVFRIVAIVMLVLSFAMPLTIPDVTVVMFLSLEVMHVVAYMVIVGLLTTLARQEASAVKQETRKQNST